MTDHSFVDFHLMYVTAPNKHFSFEKLPPKFGSEWTKSQKHSHFRRRHRNGIVIPIVANNLTWVGPEKDGHTSISIILLKFHKLMNVTKKIEIKCQLLLEVDFLLLLLFFFYLMHNFPFRRGYDLVQINFTERNILPNIQMTGGDQK